MPRALAKAVKPPAARYASMSRTAPPSVPAKTICGCSGTAELLHDSAHVVGVHPESVAVVDRDDGGPAAATEALDRPQRVLAVLTGRAWSHAELTLERLHDLLRTRERARDVRAHLDHAPSHRLEAVLVVERRDREAVRGRELECVRDLADGVRREPAAVCLLGETEGRHDSRERVGVLLAELLHLRAGHLSASPMTGSSEPPAAIRSAMRSPCTMVAVAWSAAKLGARNFTRHGLAPPSETR